MFCYVDRFRFERLAREHDVEVFLVPLELREGMAEEGLSAKASGLGHSARVEEHILKVARAEGVDMRIPDLIPNTHRALVMTEVARDAGEDVLRDTHAAIFDAYFLDERDIGRKDVLLSIAEQVDGLNADRVAAAWTSGAIDERLHGFRHVAIRLGVDTTPAALICNELLIGSRPYEVLREAVDRCMVTPES